MLNRGLILPKLPPVKDILYWVADSFQELLFVAACVYVGISFGIDPANQDYIASLRYTPWQLAAIAVVLMVLAKFIKITFFKEKISNGT